MKSYGLLAIFVLMATASASENASTYGIDGLEDLDFRYLTEAPTPSPAAAAPPATTAPPPLPTATESASLPLLAPNDGVEYADADDEQRSIEDSDDDDTPGPSIDWGSLDH